MTVSGRFLRLMIVRLRWWKYRLDRWILRQEDRFATWMITQGYVLRMRARGNVIARNTAETRWDPISDDDRYDRPI